MEPQRHSSSSGSSSSSSSCSNIDKKARVCSDKEIEEMSLEAWIKVLGCGTKSQGTYVKDAGEGGTSAENRPKVIAPNYEITSGNTIRIPNPPIHMSYADARIDLFYAAAAAGTPVTVGKRALIEEIEVETDSEEDENSEKGVVAEEIVLPSLNPISVETRLKPSQFYEKFVARTEKECLEELNAPQRSEEWLNARKLCITASQFGAAVGLSPYQTPDALVIDKVWNEFQGNAATAWGNEHEIHAKESFCAWFKGYLKAEEDFEFVEENLIKFSAEPWMAVSPDGLVTYKRGGKLFVDLVEFKCPAYLRNTLIHPYAKYPQNTPPHYRAQTQGIMGYLNEHHPQWKIGKCWFVVWQPHQSWITEQAFDLKEYSAFKETLKSWYFSKLLPVLTHKHNGLLVKGESSPQEILLF